MERITQMLEAQQKEKNGYKDALVRQLIETIKVVDECTIYIKYHCGIEHE